MVDGAVVGLGGGRAGDVVDGGEVRNYSDSANFAIVEVSICA